jgi:hypothetical protein
MEFSAKFFHLPVYSNHLNFSIIEWCCNENNRNYKCCEFSTNVFIIKLLFLFGKERVPTSSFQVHPNYTEIKVV